MTAVTAFRREKVWRPIRLLLARVYCQKQLKMKILIKNDIILKVRTQRKLRKNKAHLLKQRIFV